jgi:hypothetical protein
MFNSSLFNGKSLHDYFRSVQTGINSEIDAMPPVDVGQDINALISYFETKFHIEVPVLSDDISMDEPVIVPNNSMAGITLNVPFSGDHRAFHLQARQHPVIMDACTAHTDRLEFGLRIEKSSPTELQNKVKVLINQVSGGLDTLRHECALYEKEIPGWVKSKVQQRTDEIASKNLLRQTLSGIIPIKKREEAAKIITPVKRTPLAVVPKSNSSEPPNPAIEMSAYEDILGTIQSMVRVFERSPETFHGMDEEDLRMILLVALNGLYEGKATGETFNGQGKTDILIRHEDKNIFIAECLIWSGAATLRSKMDDQLFKYATWRDSKLAILVFNRNKNFTDVIAKMIDTVKTHPQCIRSLNFPHQSGARFQFKRTNDPQKEFVLTCLAFDVP